MQKLENLQLNKELKKQFDLLNEINSNINDLKEQKEQADKEFRDLINTKGIKDIIYDTIKEHDKKEQELKNAIQFNYFYKSGVKNNICNIIYCYFMNNSINLLKKYQDKRVGEKTRDKIINEIRNDLSLGLNVDLEKAYFWFYQEYSSWVLCVSINNIEIKLYKYENIEDLCTYSQYDNSIYDINDLKDIYDTRLLTIQEIEKHKQEIEKLRENINIKLTNNLNNYYIEK